MWFDLIWSDLDLIWLLIGCNCILGCSMWCIFEWLMWIDNWFMEMSVIWFDGCCGSLVVDLCVECLINSIYCPLMLLGHWYLFGSRDNMMSLPFTFIRGGIDYHFGVHNNYEHRVRPETEQQKSCRTIQLGYWLDLTPYLNCSGLMWCNGSSN